MKMRKNHSMTTNTHKLVSELPEIYHNLEVIGKHLQMLAEKETTGGQYKRIEIGRASCRERV